MQELPQAIIDEINGLEALDARALRRKYPSLLSGIEDSVTIGILRGTVAYKLQERFYSRTLSAEARDWLESGDALSPRLVASGRGIGSGARLVRFWKGEKYEALVREDGRFEFNGRIYNSLSAIAKEITGTHWNGRLFFGIK